jgi:hypothetical protein
LFLIAPIAANIPVVEPTQSNTSTSSKAKGKGKNKKK